MGGEVTFTTVRTFYLRGQLSVQVQVIDPVCFWVVTAIPWLNNGNRPTSSKNTLFQKTKFSVHYFYIYLNAISVIKTIKYKGKHLDLLQKWSIKLIQISDKIS